MPHQRQPPTTLTTSEKNKKREGEGRLSALFMGVARASVGRTFNVKPALSFTRFKGLVTARNHAQHAYTRFPSLRNPVETPVPFHPGLNSPQCNQPDQPRIRMTFLLALYTFMSHVTET